MTTLWVEIKSAYEALNRSRGFFWGVVALLALAIAASCGAFSVPASLLLRPLPVDAPQRLLRLDAYQPGNSFSMPWSYPDFKSFQDASGTAFSGMSNFSVMGVYFDSRGRVHSMPAADVGGAFFQTLGLHAFLGRTLVPSDDTTVNPAWVVVVSRAFWQHQ
ncbi:permease, partial [mine drainage metagenome]